MRIGLVCPYNFFRPGGVQICISELAEELTARGHYVRIIAPNSRQVPKDLASNIILLGNSTELNTPFHTKADLGMSISTEKIDTLLAQEKFDVLHVHEPGIPVLGVQLLARSKTANVGTMHATLPEGMVSKSFEKIMTPFAKYIEPRLHAITAVSEVAKNIAKGYAPDAEIVVVPNGIRLDKYRNTHAKKESPIKTILFIGRLERRKGARYLVEAFAELHKKHKNIRLVIVGDGRHRSRLETQIERLKVADVEFKGFVTETEKLRLLADADLFVSPALYGESFGIVLLEAMASSCVTVAGNNPGYHSVMTGLGQLSIVDPKSLEAFVQRLELMLFQADLRRLWKTWASGYVKQFDYSLVADQYEKVYRKAIKVKKA